MEQMEKMNPSSLLPSNHVTVAGVDATTRPFGVTLRLAAVHTAGAAAAATTGAHHAAIAAHHATVVAAAVARSLAKKQNDFVKPTKGQLSILCVHVNFYAKSAREKKRFGQLFVRSSGARRCQLREDRFLLATVGVAGSLAAVGVTTTAAVVAAAGATFLTAGSFFHY
uniref:Uncharacterized protein n=1 Tax=Romanomermis culicivorax TaxID=13658 RepID=A0A915IP05_ROMCU